MPIYLRLDETTLREVARITGGDYHYAGNAEQLRSVYQNLGSTLLVQKRETELSGLLSLLAAPIAVVAAALSVFWFQRVAEADGPRRLYDNRLDCCSTDAVSWVTIKPS